MIRFALALSVFVFASCDSHEWEGPEGTKRLFEGHGHAEHHDDHGAKHEDHKEDKGHH